MNIPKHIIEKAIEGGYNPSDESNYKIDVDYLGRSTLIYYSEEYPDEGCDEHSQEEIALDPLFWFSLGKALGWGACKECEGDGVCSHPKWREWNEMWGNDKFPMNDEQDAEYRKKFIEFWGVPEFSKSLPSEEYECDSCSGTGKGNDWKDNWHRFIDGLASGEDLEKFWQDLVPSNNKEI